MAGFLDFTGLSEFKGKIDEIYGSKLTVSGQTVSLISKSGVTLATGTVEVQTYSDATTSASGLMSASDKTKLDGITEGATKTAKSGTNGNLLINGSQVVIYTHPAHQAQDSGFYKVTVDGTGHVTAVTAVTKADITELGIPGQDTTYTNATQSKAGLMSGTDKTKLDGIASGAQVNVLEKVSVNGTALAISSRGVNIDLSNYATKDMVSSAVNYRGSVNTWNDLPTSPAQGDMYNVLAESVENDCPAGGNVIWDGFSWDVQGPMFVIESITTAQIDSLF